MMSGCKCPVCQAALSPMTRTKNASWCSACGATFYDVRLEEFARGELPTGFTLTPDSIQFLNFNFGRCFLSTIALAVIVTAVICYPFNWGVFSIELVGGLLMGERFLKSVFRQYKFEKKDGMLIVSSGLGKLRLTRNFPLKEITAIEVSTRRTRSDSAAVLLIKMVGDRCFLFGDNCLPLSLCALRDWYNGREFHLSPQAAADAKIGK